MIFIDKGIDIIYEINKFIVIKRILYIKFLVLFKNYIFLFQIIVFSDKT